MSIDDRKFIDPMSFTDADLPVICLCDDLRSITGWAIKERTDGDYNHAFIIHKPGMCVSQDFTGFKEKSLDKYLVPGMMLKFWRTVGLTDVDKLTIQTTITKRLALPWWRRSYDFLGTFVGQLFGVKWLQNPFQEFCSEQVADDYINPIGRTALMGIKEPSPSELNADFDNHPEIMECLGYWWSD